MSKTSTTAAATRNRTAKTVPPGKAASRGRAAQSAAKVADVKERSRQAGPDAELTRAACITYLQTHGAYSGHSRDSAAELRTAVRAHQQAAGSVAATVTHIGAAPSKRASEAAMEAADATAAEQSRRAAKAMDAKASKRSKTTDATKAMAAARQAKVADATPSGPTQAEVDTAVAALAAELASPEFAAADAAAEALVASANRAERAKLAKAELAAVKAWADAGEHGTRPATPNADAIAAKVPAGNATPAKAATTPRPERSAKYAKAMELKAAANRKRGPGKKVATAELDAIAAELLAEGMAVNEAIEVAYWVHSLAMSRAGFRAAWARAEAAQ